MIYALLLRDAMGQLPQFNLFWTYPGLVFIEHSEALATKVVCLQGNSSCAVDKADPGKGGGDLA